jgi:hypothetical protein
VARDEQNGSNADRGTQERLLSRANRKPFPISVTDCPLESVSARAGFSKSGGLDVLFSQDQTLCTHSAHRVWGYEARRRRCCRETYSKYPIKHPLRPLASTETAGGFVYLIPDIKRVGAVPYRVRKSENIQKLTKISVGYGGLPPHLDLTVLWWLRFPATTPWAFSPLDP